MHWIISRVGCTAVYAGSREWPSAQAPLILRQLLYKPGTCTRINSASLLLPWRERHSECVPGHCRRACKRGRVKSYPWKLHKTVQKV